MQNHLWKAEALEDIGTLFQNNIYDEFMVM